MISFSKVTKEYAEGVRAVDELDLNIEDGEIFVLIGPSGCGKTTTLKMINRLIDATAGSVSINGKELSRYNIHELRWNIGYVLQQIALFPQMTVAENIGVVPELKGWPKDKLRSRVDELLGMVGLDKETYRSKMPNELSGGQQQRIGVARALAADPQIVLMDEPFSALDPISREKLQDDVLSLQSKLKKTIVFVTHDMSEALKMGDRICLMKEGKVVQIGKKEEFIRLPANDFVREFMGPHIQQNEEWQHYIHETSLDGVHPEVSFHASEDELLAALLQNERVAVRKDGKHVGMIERSDAIRLLASRSREVAGDE